MKRTRNGVDEDGNPVVDSVGSASGADGSSADHPVAVLWVPDVDARHKWREYRVERPQPKRGQVGFKK